MIKKVGYTTDGKLVLSGIAKIYFEQGLPLVFIFDTMSNYNMLPSWPFLYKELRDNGIPHNRIIHLLNEHVFESYGKEFRDVVISRLENIFGNSENS